VVVVPPEVLSVSGVAHGGTVMGPTTPVEAATPVAEVASTRQKSGKPGLNGRRTSTEVISTTVVSSRGAAKPASRLTRSR